MANSHKSQETMTYIYYTLTLKLEEEFTLSTEALFDLEK